jgi:hypothetical protein
MDHSTFDLAAARALLVETEMDPHASAPVLWDVLRLACDHAEQPASIATDLETRLRSYVEPDDDGEDRGEIRALMVEAADEIKRLRARVARLDPPPGKCGMSYHHADCPCDGVGGER